MRGFGIAVLVVGVFWVLIAMNMDVSVGVGLTGRVNNIGLMAERSNQTMIGGFIAIAGLLMLIFGRRRLAVNAPLPATDIAPCPFCAEPIKQAAIKCKHCGSDVVIKAQGLRFGWVAVVSCTDQTTRDQVTDCILNSRLPAIDMLGWDVAAGAFKEKAEAKSAKELLSKDFDLDATIVFRNRVSGDYK